MPATRMFPPSVSTCGAGEGDTPFKPPFSGFAMKNQPRDSSKEQTLRTTWLQRVRLSPLEQTRIRELYGPKDFSENIRIRLLQKRPGRPRRFVVEAAPQITRTIQLCLLALESLRDSIPGLPSKSGGLGLILISLTAIEEHLIQTLDAHKISEDDRRLPDRRKGQ